MSIFEIDPDIRKAMTLASDFYTDPAYFELSKEKIFARSWQFLRHTNEIESLMPDEFTDHNKPEVMMANAGLDRDGIVAAVKNLL